MNSDKNEAEKLPDGWILCKSKSNPGRKYYFNQKTGKSSWTQPQADDEKLEPSKQKSKKEKIYPEKSKKEEVRNNLKRKSDSTDDSFCKKKQKQEPPTPEKCYRVVKKKPESSPAQRHNDAEASSISVPELDTSDSSRKGSPAKCLNTNRKYSPPLCTPTKNLANARLTQLRAQLSLEAQSTKDEEKSPVKATKHTISPQSQQCEIKYPRLDLNFSESKCTMTQSPSSDSFQSTPSPSQFFAANKIISSMKAQLPEKYCNKLKPKDTFADIEEGICNQTAEYPFMKHPATPPQFSEASKLMSAIKSKLSYKVSPKDTSVKQFTSANARLDSIRARLSNDSMDTKDVIENNFLGRREMPKYCEAMDVEDCKETNQTNETKPPVQYMNIKNNLGPNGSKEDIVLVVDTNIFIHELDVIRNVLNSHIKGYSEQPTLLVPWRVVNELDRLKDNNNGNGAICKRARAAMDYLYKSLPENNRIKGQSLRDANSHIYPCELPDDEILNCCLQQAERGKSVILLSNDKNLCNKAHVNGVKCIGLAQLKPLLVDRPQPAAGPGLRASVRHYENTMYHLLANILENEMRAKYNNLWQHVLFKAPPWTLTDVLQCLLKHWVAVFNEVFPRIEYLITDLRNTLISINNKDPKSISQSEMTNFKDLCMEIAKKCQIIPEYMELAKATVDRLERGRDGGGAGEMMVIDAFEGLWTVFSSYCAKMASALDIQHNIEDKLPGAEPLPALTNKWPTYRSHINALAVAMKGAITVDAASLCLEERVSRLAAVFADSLKLTGMDASCVNKDNVRVFCTSCRNMLQEACTKFSELTELLNVCEDNMPNI